MHSPHIDVAQVNPALISEVRMVTMATDEISYDNRQCQINRHKFYSLHLKQTTFKMTQYFV